MPAILSELEWGHALSLGQIDAFDALYHQYRQPVYANILKLVKQPEAAEDILQEVFVALWENRQKIDPDKPVGGWLFVVSYNKAASFLKKKIRESVVIQHQSELPDPQAADEPIDEELYGLQLALIEEAVTHLPARKREIFRLCRFEGQSYEDVAQLTGLSVASVRDYLKQSTRFIRDYIRTESSSSQLVAVPLLLLFLEHH